VNRRRFLSPLPSAVAPSVVLGRCCARVQTSPVVRAGSTTARPVAVEITVSAPGVNAGEIKIGMSAAFRGTAAGLGTELYRGAQACYADVNARGGIDGRAITVAALDDGYEPTPCSGNTVRLIEKEAVFFLSNYVGTPTLTRALPVIKQYADQQVILVGNFAGAQPQQEDPYVEHAGRRRGPRARRREIVESLA
jgi:branched-chain amino acid transport system substrate-binding protein